jgi:hypothetical protein
MRKLCSTADVFRQHGISEATLCRSKTKYGGLEVSEGVITPKQRLAMAAQLYFWLPQKLEGLPAQDLNFPAYQLI